MTEKWKLRRTRQCAKCPWKVSCDPYEIPEYDSELHAALEDATIAHPGDRLTPKSAMACHESKLGDEDMCVGWIYNQLGVGNNIALRYSMTTCKNLNELQVDGEQHERFEDTLPGDFSNR